nr:hypothetical protein [Tanacetum cinerariifolium]
MAGKRTPVDTKSKHGSDGDPASDSTLYRSLAGDHGLQLYVSSTSQLNAYIDADWAGCPVTGRSTLVIVCLLEIICYLETAWIRNLLRELHNPLFTATLVYRDNVNTPLFEGMIVAQQADDVADEGAADVDVDVFPTAADEPSIPSPTPTTQPPPPSQELPSTLHISQQLIRGSTAKARVPDVTFNEFEEELSWNSTDDEGDDDEGKDGDGDEEDDGDGGKEGDGDDDDKDDDGEKGDDDDDQEVVRDDDKDNE